MWQSPLLITPPLRSASGGTPPNRGEGAQMGGRADGGITTLLELGYVIFGPFNLLGVHGGTT
eukprot:3776755-Alexandrium_andersonii.AAC.1